MAAMNQKYFSSLVFITQRLYGPFVGTFANSRLRCYNFRNNSSNHIAKVNKVPNQNVVK